MNNKLSNRSGVGSLKNSAGDHAVANKEKAEIFNDYFAAVCTDDNGIIPPISTSAPAGCGIDGVLFDEAKILAAANNIRKKNKLSSGPDGYPTKLLSAVCTELAAPRTMMFNSFMSVGKLPSAWKQATVTPIFKKGSSADPVNYRPISQTSVFCKLFERIIAADITDYLLKKLISL